VIKTYSLKGALARPKGKISSKAKPGFFLVEGLLQRAIGRLPVEFLIIMAELYLEVAWPLS
jgi:hypothetical protein